MQENIKKLVYIFVAVGILILAVWGGLIIYSVDVQGIRVLRGVALSKQIVIDLCEDLKTNSRYPINYNISEARRKFNHVEDFSYKLNNGKYQIEFRVNNIVRKDTYFTVTNEGISVREGNFGETHKEAVGHCE